jgi:hypothetical protein
LTLTYNGDELVGLIDFGSFPMGMATVYARVLDEVDNLSAIVSKAIRVISSEFMKVTAQHEKFGNVDIDHDYTNVGSVEVGHENVRFGYVNISHMSKEYGNVEISHGEVYKVD